MKRIFLTIVILLVTGIAVFAQQATALEASSRPTSSQTREDAREYLTQGRSLSSQFTSSQAELNARNTSNNDAHTFGQLRAELDRLEAAITQEQNRRAASLDKGLKVEQDSLDNIQPLIDQYNAKLAELETFLSR